MFVIRYLNELNDRNEEIENVFHRLIVKNRIHDRRLILLIDCHWFVEAFEKQLDDRLNPLDPKLEELIFRTIPCRVTAK